MLIQETNMFFRINKLLFCVKLQLVTAISDVKKKKKKKTEVLYTRFKRKPGYK